jgi:hypothetical protein
LTLLVAGFGVVSAPQTRNRSSWRFGDLQYSLDAPRRGHDDIKAFMIGFREAFPDLSL